MGLIHHVQAEGPGVWMTWLSTGRRAAGRRAASRRPGRATARRSSARGRAGTAERARSRCPARPARTARRRPGAPQEHPAYAATASTGHSSPNPAGRPCRSPSPHKTSRTAAAPTPTPPTKRPPTGCTPRSRGTPGRRSLRSRPADGRSAGRWPTWRPGTSTADRSSADARTPPGSSRSPGCSPQVMTSQPYLGADRVFWIVDNGSSHRGQASAERINHAWPTARLIHLPVHASWLDQCEIYFSVVQRKVVTPNDFTDLDQIRQPRVPDPRTTPSPGPSTGSSLATISTTYLQGIDSHQTQADDHGWQHETAKNLRARPLIVLC
jgi:hypothetical protein